MRTSLVALTLGLALTTGACNQTQTSGGTGSSSAAASASGSGRAATSASGTGSGATSAPKPGSLGEEVQKLTDIDAAFAKLEKVKAVLVLLDLFMKTDAWQTAAKTTPALAEASTVVASLKDAVKKLEGLQSTIKNSRDLVKGIADTLANTEAGKQAVAEVAKAKAEIKSKVEEIAKQLDAVSKGFSGDVIEPALAQFGKIEPWIEAVCAIITLAGDADQKKACKEADGTIKEAKEYLESIKNMPGQMVRELVASLEKALGEAVKGTGLEKLLDAPAPSTSASAGASATPSASAAR